jgi:uncharacterized protein (DUF934 family)
MPEIILRDRVVADTWQVFRPEADTSATVPAGPVLVPLATWLDAADALAARGDVGVWIASHEDPATLRAWLERLPLVAVDFPKFTDGRGYSIGHLLRTRYGYRGELRAIGDVLPDQLDYLRRVGFDAYAVRADKDIHDALRLLTTFSQPYQNSWEPSLPAFRRIARGQGTEVSR